MLALGDAVVVLIPGFIGQKARITDVVECSNPAWSEYRVMGADGWQFYVLPREIRPATEPQQQGLWEASGDA